MGRRGRLFAALLLVLCAASQAPAQKAHRHSKRSRHHASAAKPAPKKIAAAPKKAAEQPIAPQIEEGPPKLDTVKGSILKLNGATLEVGLQDGGIELFDVGTK